MSPGSGTGGGRVSRRDALAAVAGAGTLAVAGCVEFRSARSEGGGLEGTVDVRGSSTVEPLIAAMAEEFTGEHDGVVINTTATGTGAGFNDFFCTGQSDFNNASRAIREPERESCADAGVEFLELTLATDALTVVVNNDADFVDCLTVEELAAIWSGDGADRWNEVRDDFPDQSISRFGPADTSGTYDYFRSAVLGEETEHTRDYQGTEDDNSIIAGVRGDRHAIGYLGFSHYYNDPEAVTAVGIDAGDGCVEPSVETAAAGEYDVLSRPLFTYVSTSSLRSESVAEFARYVLRRSTDRALVAEDVGYVPNSPERMGIELHELEGAIREVQE